MLNSRLGKGSGRTQRLYYTLDMYPLSWSLGVRWWNESCELALVTRCQWYCTLPRSLTFLLNKWSQKKPWLWPREKRWLIVCFGVMRVVHEGLESTFCQRVTEVLWNQREEPFLDDLAPSCLSLQEDAGSVGQINSLRRSGTSENRARNL